MDPKTVEVLGNLALKFMEQAMKQQSQGLPQQQPAMQQPSNFAPGFGAYPAFWNPGMPPAFNPQCYPAFDPSGFYPAPGFGWNGNPWTFC